jgi:hypothetical protein
VAEDCAYTSVVAVGIVALPLLSWIKGSSMVECWPNSSVPLMLPSWRQCVTEYKIVHKSLRKVQGQSLNLCGCVMPVVILTKCIILTLKLVKICHTGPCTHKVYHFGP